MRDRKQLDCVISSKIVSHLTKSEKASCVRMGKKMSILESFRAVGLIGAAAENFQGSWPPRERQPARCRSGTAVGRFQARERMVRLLGWFLLMPQLGTSLVAGTRSCPLQRSALAPTLML